MADEFQKYGLTPAEVAATETINETDNHITARTKKVVADQIRSGEYRSSAGVDWIGLLWFAFFLFSIGMCYLPNYFAYKWPVASRSADGAPRYSSESKRDFEKRQADFLASSESLKQVFVPTAPLEKIFAGCRKPCATPDAQAFDKFRRYALVDDKALYEDAVCGAFFHTASQPRWPTPEVRYRFDLEQRSCVIANEQEVRQAIRQRNDGPLVRYWQWAVWLAVLAGVISLHRRRKKA